MKWIAYGLLISSIVVTYFAALVVIHDLYLRVESLMDAIEVQYDITDKAIEAAVFYKGQYEQMNGLSSVLAKVGSIPYENPGNNCYDHSKALVSELEKVDIESSIFINEGRRHAWVAVWIEANTGKFISTGHPYNPVLEIRDKKLNVICS